MADTDPTGVPAPITDTERAIDNRGLDRALRGKGSIPPTKTSNTAATPPPEPPKYPWITKKIDIFVLAGNNLNSEDQLAAAARIWSQCHIRLQGVSRTEYDESQTRSFLATEHSDQEKPLKELTLIVNPDETTVSMQKLRSEWFNNRHGDYAVFFIPKVRLTTNGAPSAADPTHDIVYIGVTKYWTGWELAHELGHRFIGSHLTHAALDSPLMHPANPGDEIVEVECRAARGDLKARYELIKRSESR